VINRLVVFGGTGDLMGRYLLPGLAALRAQGHLPELFELVGAAREDWDDERFRNWAAEWLNRTPTDPLIADARYAQLDLADPANVAKCLAGEGPVAVYLALPPAVFPIAMPALQQAGLPEDSQVVFEKPFGEDLASATALNRLIAEQMDERHVFRVDHFLAMTTVQNVLATRLANRVLEPIWNRAHIDEVEIVWDESLALEGRVGYYDWVGALKDMVQNHLLQRLCLVAMEPQITLDERDLRDRKLDVLRSVKPIDVAAHTRRARYRPAGSAIATSPPTSTKTASRPSTAPRPSPRWCSSSTTGAGRARASGCARARRWDATARRSSCTSAPRRRTPSRRHPACWASGSSLKA
jgi:glucose-6-phosphate 1-dehydrogenase